MEHIVQFAIGIDDEAIRNRIARYSTADGIQTELNG